jgi:signal transduction histidine kinase
MQRSKLSVSNIILIVICLAVILFILFQNLINTRDLMQMSDQGFTVNAQKAAAHLSWVSLVVILLIVGILVYNIYKTTQYEKEILEAREHAEKLAQVKARFLSTMSHEIRSPLTAIMGFAELIDKMELDAEKRKYVDAIKASSEHLLGTVNDVLDFSKLDAGKLKLEKKPFFVTKAIEDVAFALSNTAAVKKGLVVITDVQINKQFVVNGDGLRLRQILYNLLGNAIKFTNAGTVKISAAIAEQNEEKAIIKISVSDTGIGIPTNQLQTIFDEFTQVTSNNSLHANRRSIKGTGLGLSICKLLVELQGGVIGVESMVGEGATFTFKIPYEVAKINDTTSAKAIENDMEKDVLKGKKVLVVEDNEVNIMLISLQLKKLEIQFDISKDGTHALQMFQAHNYDAVLTDINVPGLTGDQLAAAIRRLHNVEKAAIPIIALTATILQDDIDAYMQSGLNAILVKPFKQAELKNILEKFLSVEPLIQ